MAWNPFRKARQARELEFEAADRWRVARRLADHDVTNLGEQLADLHVDTLASDLDDEASHHYRRSLEHYEQAKDRVSSSTTAEDVLGAEQLLADARRLEGGEAPETRMVRVRDRYVAVHEAGGVEAILDRHRSLSHERSTSHNKKSMAEAYIDQAINGFNGPGGGGRL